VLHKARSSRERALVSRNDAIGDVLDARAPSARSLSLHHLRDRQGGVARQLRWYYGTVGLPTIVLQGITAISVPSRPAPTINGTGGHATSRSRCRRRARSRTRPHGPRRGPRAEPAHSRRPRPVRERARRVDAAGGAEPPSTIYRQRRRKAKLPTTTGVTAVGLSAGQDWLWKSPRHRSHTPVDARSAASAASW